MRKGPSCFRLRIFVVKFLFIPIILEGKHVSLFLYSEVKGNLILHLTPEPLPDMSDQLQDEELDLSMEGENQGENENFEVPVSH